MALISTHKKRVVEHSLVCNGMPSWPDLKGIPADGNTPLWWAPVGQDPLLSGKCNLTDEWKAYGEMDEIAGESPPLTLSWMLLRWHESWRG